MSTGAAVRVGDRGASLRRYAAYPGILVCALILTTALRLPWIGSVPFDSGDDVSLAWASVWYFPRSLDAFRVGDGSVDPNPLGIATLPHGPLQVGLAWAWIGMC